MYTVVGLSRQNGSLKLRFANDFVTRIKVLERNGHKDVHLEEIKDDKGNILSMTKEQAVAWLSTKGGFFATVEAQSVFADYQSKTVKTTPAPKAKTAAKTAELA